MEIRKTRFPEKNTAFARYLEQKEIFGEGKMNVEDLEKIAESGDLNDETRVSLTKYVLDSYVPLFTKGLQDAVGRCQTRVDVLHLLARMEKVYRHVIAPALEGRVEDIAGRLPKNLLMDKAEYEVTYNGPYPTFGHAILDFRIQTDVAGDKIARRLYMSTRTIWQLENNQQPTGAKAITYYRRNEEKIKKLFLSMFKIPPEHEDELMAVPLFPSGVKSAREEYGSKRSLYRRRSKEKKE